MDIFAFRYFIDNPVELLHKSVIENNIFYYCHLAGDYLILSVLKYTYMYVVQHFMELILYITINSVKFYLYFIYLNFAFRCQYLLDITITDYYETDYQFQLMYNLVSMHCSLLFFIKAFVGKFIKVNSIKCIFRGALWYEREIWDFFGIIFVGNFDLCRRLTDYAFEEYPLKKDFPLGGFVEVKYSEFIKRLSYLSLKAIKEFKIFELVSPWCEFINFKFNDLFDLYKNGKNSPLHLNYL